MNTCYDSISFKNDNERSHNISYLLIWFMDITITLRLLCWLVAAKHMIIISYYAEKKRFCGLKCASCIEHDQITKIYTY